MNFKISKNRFYNAVQTVNHAISANSPVPSLCGVFIEIKDQNLILTGSDADISIQMTLNNTLDEKLMLTVIEEGKIVVDSRYLMDIVRKMDNDSIQIEIIDGTLIRFAGNKVEYKINGYRPEDYPSIDFSTPAIQFEINSEEFSSMIRDTSFAAAAAETRPVLTGVNFYSDGEKLTVTATDSYRLARKILSLSSEEFNITVPAKSLNEVRSIFNNPQESITIALSPKKIQFISPAMIMQSRLLDGGYPETERLIPNEFSHRVVINRNALITAIDRTAFIKTDNMPYIRLQLNDKDDITMTNKSQEIGESREELFALEYEGEPLDISFSGTYVMDAAKALNGKEIIIQFTGNMKPFIMTSSDQNANALQLVLPVRTYN